MANPKQFSIEGTEVRIDKDGKIYIVVNVKEEIVKDIPGLISDEPIEVQIKVV